MKKLGVIVARFQVSSLHAGHKHLIHMAMNECDRVVIFLGHPKDGKYFTKKNPIHFFYRKEMITKDYPDITVAVIVDTDDDLLWVNMVDQMIDHYKLDYEQPILFGSRDSFLNIYNKHSGKYSSQLV